MKKPSMMFFDLGDTIITSRNREPFHYDAVFAAVLDKATANPGNVKASQLVHEPRKDYCTGHHELSENLNYLKAEDWQDVMEAIG